MVRQHSSLLTLAALSLAGCATVPDLGPVPQPRRAETVAAERTLAATTAAAWPERTWWQAFGDAQLTSLIEEGVRNSPDTAIAVARLRRAAGAAQLAGAARYPSVGLQGQTTLDKQSYNNGFPREFMPQGWNDRGQVQADLSFDLDLWGKNRAALAAATSEQRAASIDVSQAELLLTTSIAAAYVDLARLFAERDVREGELKGYETSRRLVADRMANGLDTRGSLAQAEAQLATARAALVETDQAIGARRNELALLIGAGPDRGLDIARPVLRLDPHAGVPRGVTTDLVGRRPDVVSARERVEAAASRIKVARADFYPAVSLSALVGLQSLGLSNLVAGDSLFGSVGPAVSLPIFRGGALQGRYRSSRAEYDEAVGNYDRTVLAAYREVADAVTAQRMIERRLGEARTALAASNEAYRIASQRYRAGLSNYLDVLVVEDRLLQARLAVTQLEGASRAAQVQLIRALGGGFAVSDAAQDRPDA